MVEYTITIIVAIVASGLGALIAGLFNRTPTLVKTAMEMLDRAVVRIDQLEEQAGDQKIELQQVIAAMDDVNSELLKFKLVVFILSEQLKKEGIKPKVNMARIATMQTNELNGIARSMNLEIPQE